MATKIKALFTFILLPAIAAVLISWGTFGHEHINHAAVLALPPPLQTFFYNHIDFITQESTVPDLRKHTLKDKAERPRHYINLESYGRLDSLPLTLEEAEKKYGEAFLTKNGTLPWYLKVMMERLTKAFKEKRKTEILFLAADLGHYLGDAHMPLHITVNHDGELTGQEGIHAFWEAQLPDLFGDTYNYHTQTAKYIDNIHKEIRELMRSTYSLADTMLSVEKRLSKSFPAEKIYERDGSGAIVKNKFGQMVHSAAYAKKYHELLDGMVEKQMAKAIAATAGFWYTAWLNAGKPDLSDLDPQELTLKNAAALEQALKLWQQGRLYGLKSEREF